MNKNVTLFILFLTGSCSVANAQTTLFKETFGTTKDTRSGCTSVTTPGTAESGKYDPVKNELFSDHDWSSDSHTWTGNESYSQTSAASTNVGACDDSGTTLNIRTNNPGAYTGASAAGNLYFNANTTNAFTISGINTTNYSGCNLSFWVYGKNKSDVVNLKLEYSTGGDFITIGSSVIGALSTTKQTWLNVSGISLESTSNLSLRFSTPYTNSSNSNAAIEIRIDDIVITGNASVSGLTDTENTKAYVSRTGNTLSLHGFTDGSIEIVNLSGKKVYESAMQTQLSPNLASGVYILRIGAFRQKIVF